MDSFKAKVIKLSNISHGVIIPKQYFDDGHITAGKEYTFQFKEVKE